MKKGLIFLLVGVVIVIAAVVIILMNSFKGSPTTMTTGEANVPELPQSQWPAVSFVPSSDPTVPNSLGHYLDFKVEKINVSGAASMDYELVYNTVNGGQQGIPGTVKITGTSFERNLLLGSASSGHYRFDEGVNQGTMTIRFRNSAGKLLGKVATTFSLQTGTTTLTSVDGKFTYELTKAAKGVYFVTMPTLVEPTSSANIVIYQNGYAVFSSDAKPHAGSVK